MKITVDIYGWLNDAICNTIIKEVKPITEWRKGLCICIEEEETRYGYTPHIAYIVDSNNHAIFHKSSRESGSCWQTGYCIERVFGGFYVAYQGKCACRTFPGQDRDTEYSYYNVVTNIFTEDGIELTEKEMKQFLKKNKIVSYKELNNGVILCNGSTYRLNDYSLISKLPENIYIHNESTNGEYLVDLYNERCNLYVITYRKMIIRYFKEEDFADICNILKVPIPSFYKKSVKQIPPEGISTPLANPRYIERIKGYWYSLDPVCGYPLDNFSRQGPLIIRQDINYTGFFKSNNKWFTLDFEGFCKTANFLRNNYYPVPNYITQILFLSKVTYKGKNCSLHLFKCEPKGSIDTNGVFHYEFDTNNIKWY